MSKGDDKFYVPTLFYLVAIMASVPIDAPAADLPAIVENVTSLNDTLMRNTTADELFTILLPSLSPTEATTTTTVFINQKEVSTLSATQMKLLSVLSIVPVLMSVTGSLTIISMVISSKRLRTKTTTYRRLLLGLSIIDVLVSASYPFWWFLLPREYPDQPHHASNDRVWAFGNNTTCQILGFFQQIGLGTVAYNGMLSFYFLLTVRYGWREEHFIKKWKLPLSSWFPPSCLCCHTYQGIISVDRVMHLLAAGFPFVGAVVGLAYGFYGPSDIGPGCWINDYPRNCGYDIGETGEPCISQMLAYIFGGSIVFPSLIAITTNHIIIYRHVRKTVLTSRRRNSVTSLYQNQRKHPQQEHGEGITLDSSPSRASSTLNQEPKRHRQRRRSSLAKISEIQKERRRRRRNGNQHAKNQIERVKEVATQGLLYVAAGFATAIWTLLIKNIEGQGGEASDESRLFWLLCLQSLLGPLQGMFNLLIFVRPNYLRIRKSKEFRNQTRWWALRRAIYGEAVQPRLIITKSAHNSSGNDSGNKQKDSGKHDGSNSMQGTMMKRGSSKRSKVQIVDNAVQQYLSSRSLRRERDALELKTEENSSKQQSDVSGDETGDDMIIAMTVQRLQQEAEQRENLEDDIEGDRMLQQLRRSDPGGHRTDSKMIGRSPPGNRYLESKQEPSKSKSLEMTIPHQSQDSQSPGVKGRLPYRIFNLRRKKTVLGNSADFKTRDSSDVMRPVKALSLQPKVESMSHGSNEFVLLPRDDGKEEEKEEEEVADRPGQGAHTTGTNNATVDASISTKSINLEMIESEGTTDIDGPHSTNDDSYRQDVEFDSSASGYDYSGTDREDDPFDDVLM